jgi:RHS repeat-associated protein
VHFLVKVKIRVQSGGRMSETLIKTHIKQQLYSLAVSIFLVLSCMAFAVPTYAEGIVPVGEQACWDGSSDGSGKSMAGKPVNLFTGSEIMMKTDLSIGSIYPITIQRQYNSTSVFDSSLGYGWALNYDKRLYLYPDGSAIVRKNCGQKLRFTWSVLGFIPPLGEYGKLAWNADGTFTYTDKDGSKENYDAFGRLASVADAKGNSLVLTYTSDLRTALMGLLFANLNQGAPLIVSYDYRLSKIEEKGASGNLTGASVTLSYDSYTGRLSGISDSTSRAISYTHDPFGNLTGVAGPAGNANYGYNNSTYKHSLTDIDEGQGAYINAYDTSGRVIKQTHGTGVIDIEYLANQTNKVTTTVKDQDSNVLTVGARTVVFNNRGVVTKNTDAFGNVTNYIRDPQTSKIMREEYWENSGTVDTPTHALKAATDYTYDQYSNLLTKTEASRTDSSEWDAIKKTTWYHYIYELNPSASPATYNKVRNEIVASVVDAAQYRYVTYGYDDTTGNLLTTTETGLSGDGSSYSYTTTYGYDANGRMTGIDGPRTDVQDDTTYAYDSSTGYRPSMTQPLVGTTTYSNFDALGNPQTVTDPNGNSTTYTYDPSGRVSTVKAPGDTNATQYFYVNGGSCGSSCSGANKIDHITLPEGNTIWYAYDSMGNLTTIKDSLNNSLNYTYDSIGNKLTEQIKDSAGSLQKTLSYQYDALNRLSKVTNPDSAYTQYTYDSRGNRTAIQNPKSAITNYSYDALNRLTSVLQPLTASTSYTYNSNNNLTTVTDANSNTTQYKYDDKGRVYQIISPDAGTTTYSYDPAGDIISKTDAKGITISYHYDALNRLTTIDFPTDTDIVYSYDSCVNGKGRLCSMTDASGTTVYEYSSKGQVKKETKTIDSNQYVTQYAYDQNGNLKTMTYPSGKVITYNYTNDRVVSVLKDAANLATSISYKPFGGMSSINYGNGLVGTIGYDNKYRTSSITVGTVMNLGYAGYDNNGNITAITNNIDTSKNKSFTYDNLDRLATATSTGIWGTLGWTYDGVGNRQAENSNSYTYTTGSNKLSSANGLSYGFDNNGNTTAEGARLFTYNQNQRLIRVVDGGVTKGEYTYNGNGQRVKKIVDGVTTVFHYSLNGQIIAESDNTGTITAEYVYLNGQPLAKIERANTYYYHNDHLGTPQKLTDSTGQVVWAADYKPFGETTVTVSTITNNLGFPGQYRDAETGPNYNYYRDYNPVIGRYIEADPIGLSGGDNLYSYVADNPVFWVDPLGLFLTNPNNINCVGYASGAGQAIYPDTTKDESLKNMIEAQGFECSKTSGECKCKCNSDRMVVYIYTYKDNPNHKDPWKDPWIRGQGNDYHGIKSASGCSGPWTYVHANLPKDSPYAKPDQTPDPNNPDSYWENVPKDRYCCCKEKAK